MAVAPAWAFDMDVTPLKETKQSDTRTRLVY